jgi:hypothetical protein
MSIAPVKEPAAIKPRHTPVFYYLEDPPEQFQRWPPDPSEEARLIWWRNQLNAEHHVRHCKAYLGRYGREWAPSCINPDAETHYPHRPHLAEPPPPPPPSDEPHFPGMCATENEAVRDQFREVHATFSAPFGGPEWVALVNWRRREGEAGRLARGEYEHLMRYLVWAEGRHDDLNGRGRAAYEAWLATPPAAERRRASELTAANRGAADEATRLREAWRLHP